MKQERKKAGILMISAAAVLTAAQLTVLGAKGGIGPLGFLKKDKTPEHPGNGPKYDFDTIVPMRNSPLKGKNICILGSSVAFGSASQQSAVGEYLSARLGARLTKETVSGTTLADVTKNSYVRRIKKLDRNAKFDLLICQLSTNDATWRLPIGKIHPSRDLKDFDTAKVTGAMEYIIRYAQLTWDCPVVFFTGSWYDSPRYGAMVKQLRALAEKWGIGVLNLYENPDFNRISEEKRQLYMNDPIHPTKAGYRDWWGPELEAQLLNFLKDKGEENEKAGI